MSKRFQKIKRQPDALLRTEINSLITLLKENDLYRPGMGIKEMRKIGSFIAPSMFGREFFEKSFLSNETIHKSEQQAKNYGEQPAKKSNQHTERSTRVPNASLDNYSMSSNSSNCNAADSDSDESYSPSFPGPCCLQTHVVHVEVHPEPRSDEKDDDDRFQKIMSPRKQMISTTNEWDSIDEF